MNRSTLFFVLIALAGIVAGAALEATMSQGVYAVFVTTEGQFTIKLYDQDAPKTVANFVGLADGTKEWTDPRTGQKVQKPYYDGIVFHRVIDGFMIQGGDPLGREPAVPATTSPTSSVQTAPLEGRDPVDGEPRSEHERRAVLHHPGAHAVAR